MKNQDLAMARNNYQKQNEKKEASSFFDRTWRWHPLAPISNETKTKKQRKKRGNLGFFSTKSWRWNPRATRSNKTKEKKEKKGGLGSSSTNS
jgi:hypothetical protein